MKTIQNPRDLFFDQLSDIFSMESQLADSMPHLASLAADARLADLIRTHGTETETHRTKALGIFTHHHAAPAGDPCKAIAGLIEGGHAHLEQVGDKCTRDLMLVAHCLRVEHYEIAAYEITVRLADRLGMYNEAVKLHEALAQEKKMAEALLELEPDLVRIAFGNS
jgi:ferritin-like metal-binding protein YciE